mmetsp:Transcript_954/g.2572  ORF Transcript_954/g.2572 Transcript_954/m.2572 type:complete len:213 (+) Transcript_954:3439-4077(+)
MLLTVTSTRVLDPGYTNLTTGTRALGSVRMSCMPHSRSPAPRRSTTTAFSSCVSPPTLSSRHTSMSLVLASASPLAVEPNRCTLPCGNMACTMLCTPWNASLMVATSSTGGVSVSASCANCAVMRSMSCPGLFSAHLLVGCLAWPAPSTSTGDRLSGAAPGPGCWPGGQGPCPGPPCWVAACSCAACCTTCSCACCTCCTCSACCSCTSPAC